jgi:Leucine-rich repeat (LRR) protein
LEVLDLQRNRLTVLPAISTLTNLEYIVVYGNPFKFPPFLKTIVRTGSKSILEFFDSQEDCTPI